MFSNVRGRGRLAAMIGVCAAGVIAAAGVTATGASASAAVAQSQARVPWASVGPGWELVVYTNGTPAKPAPATLYLVSPGGTRYSLHTWRSSASAPSLVDWSGDKTRALFYENAGNGYTRPAGLSILGVRANGSVVTLARYSLTGKLVKVQAGRADAPAHAARI